MRKLLAITLALSLMCLHQECRVANLDPEPVTYRSQDATVTIVGNPVLNDNVFVIDSSSVEILSVTQNQIVLKGDIRFKNRVDLRGGRVAANDCPGNIQTANKIVGFSGLTGLPAVALSQDANCIRDANNGVITTLYYSSKFPPLTGPTGLFKYLKLFVKRNYITTNQKQDIEINKSAIKVVDDKGIKVNASQNGKLSLENQLKAEFTFDIDYGNAQNPDNPELQRINYLGFSFALEDSFKATTKLEGEVNVDVPVPLIPPFDLGEINIPVGESGLFINIAGQFELPLNLSAKGTIKADGKIVEKTIRFRWGKEYRDGDAAPRDIEPLTSQDGEWIVLNQGTIELDFKICLTPTIKINIGQLNFFAIKLFSAPTNIVMILGMCYGAKYTCSTSGNGVSMSNYIEIEPKATFEITLLSSLKEEVEQYVKENKQNLSLATILLLKRVDKIPSKWSLPDDSFNNSLFTDGKIVIPQGTSTVFQGVLCNGGQIPDSTTASNAPPTPGTCIPQVIIDQVAKKQLSGFTALADGDGTNPPGFINGSVFEFTPVLHSSNRSQDKIYLDEHFGKLRLRFTYPDGKLKVDIKQYDDASNPNLILSGNSLWTEVSGHDDVFRICMALTGTTNNLSYTNRVVIIGRLSSDKRTIKDVHYIMLVEGESTNTYLLNGRSIRVFRSDGPAYFSNQFRVAVTVQSQQTSGLSLLSK